MKELRQRLAGEVVFVVLLAAISAFFAWTSYQISGFSSPSSPGSFPMAASFMMVASGIYILVTTLRARAVELFDSETMIGAFIRQLTPPVIVVFLLAVLVFTLLLEQLGFVVSAFLFMVVAPRLLGSRRWSTNLFAAVVSVACVYIVFKTAFSVVLPQGDLLKALLADTPYLGWLP